MGIGLAKRCRSLEVISVWWTQIHLLSGKTHPYLDNTTLALKVLGLLNVLDTGHKIMPNCTLSAVEKITTSDLTPLYALSEM